MDTKWTPQLSPDGPRYRALADAIADAVEEGVLCPGEKLPAVRDLAWRLSLTPGTIARGYQLAESRRFVEARVGSGTFVSQSTLTDRPLATGEESSRAFPTEVSIQLHPPLPMATG